LSSKALDPGLDQGVALVSAEHGSEPNAAGGRIKVHLAAFEGFGRVAAGMTYVWDKQPWEGRQQSIRLYLPNRSAQVLAPKLT